MLSINTGIVYDFLGRRLVAVKYHTRERFIDISSHTNTECFSFVPALRRFQVRDEFDPRFYVIIERHCERKIKGRKEGFSM